MLSCATTHGNICLGAIVGSLLTCVVVILPIPYAVIKVVLFHMLVNTCMIRVGLKIKTIPPFIKAIILLYVGGFLLGGIMEYFSQYVRVGSLFFLVAIVSYYLVLGIWKFITCLQRWKDVHCVVDLYMNGEMYQVKGLIDTGNGLRDPISGHPVHVIERKMAKRLLKGSETKSIRYIPYKTVGKSEGVLPVFRAERICVHRDGEYWVEEPLLAISEEEFSSEGEYEMILNPSLF